MTPPQIKIRSHHATREVLASAPGRWHVVLITNTGVSELPGFRGLAADLLHLQFDDIVTPQARLIAPSEDHVRRAMEWADGRTPLLVSCTGGVSRSSALAYVLACCREHHPRLAANILTPLHHYPNEAVVRHGAAVLGDRAVLDEYHRWLRSPLP